MITENNFGTGGIKQARDERVASFHEIVADSPLFDWDKGFDIRTKKHLSLKNQGQSSSCGGQASSYLTEAIVGVECSARSIYSKCFAPGGGSSESALMKTILNDGVAREQDVSSYENGNPPSEQFMQTGYGFIQKVSRGIRPVYINLNFDSIATAVQQNNGVILGISAQNNGTWLSPNPTKPTLQPHESGLWYHWVYVGFAGMRNGVKMLGFKNSWGDIGENGWQFIGEEWLPYLWCAWSIVYQDASSKPRYTFANTLEFGKSSKDIKALQDILRYEGMFNNTSTGYYGDLTASAVLSFQKKYKVAPDVELNSLHGKRVGPLTIKKLNELYAK